MRRKPDFFGSKWFKFDFHTHTPASNDYHKKDATAEEWLKMAMIAQLDCVVITDHNSGEWIDLLKTKNSELQSKNEKPAWYRQLTIFPGAEITVANSSDRIHLLAVFSPDFGSQNITGVLGACGITSQYGDDQDTSTSKSFIETIQQITKHGGIAIPAHIDGAKGLLHNTQNLTPELKKSLENVLAAEFCDLHIFDGATHPLRKELDHVAKLAGSDAHTPESIGRNFTWVKMSTPTIRGLKLAILDHKFSIKNQSEDPNFLPDIFLSKLIIKDMYHCGRVKVQPFAIDFHPHFNAIIGGRGSGKSTVLESIRIASRQDQNLANEAPRVKEELDKFMQLSQNKGVMRQETEILLEIYRRGQKYQLHWRFDGQGAAVLEENINGEFQQTDTGIIEERFPVSIFSQKQINELALNPKGLLEIIDCAPEVNRLEWQKCWDDAKSTFLQLREQSRTLLRQLDSEQQLRASLKDIENDLKQYEEKGHAEVLQQYNKRFRQMHALQDDQFFDELASRVRILAADAELSDFPAHLFDEQDESTIELKDIHRKATDNLKKVRKILYKTANYINKTKIERRNNINSSQWNNLSSESFRAYNNLVQEYKEKNSQFSMSLYGDWVQRRNNIQHQLLNLEKIREEQARIEEQTQQIYTRMLDLRKELTIKRKSFINKVIGNNNFVRMDLVLFGDISTLEKEYRSLLNIEENKFISSIYDPENEQGLLWQLSNWEENHLNESDLDTYIHDIKSKTVNIAKGLCRGNHQTFNNRLQMLREDNPSIFDKLAIWWPEDLLRVKYSKDPNSDRFEDLEKGSAGQKAAAILAFLLSHGSEPLVIDQPEDDLDNALIYDLIVKQIHDNKNRRQIIIVTHNPNIVVNGDAELVHVLNFSRGQIKLSQQGGLDTPDIQESICTIMEGGRQAFKIRYNRIMLER